MLGTRARGVLLPMCDSDVVRLSGLGFYDRSILPGKDTAGNFESVLEVWRTNHNGYNTQWQTDDTYQRPFTPVPVKARPCSSSGSGYRRSSRRSAATSSWASRGRNRRTPRSGSSSIPPTVSRRA